MSSLRDDKPMVVTQAVDTLRLCGFQECVDDVLPLLNHSSPFVGGSVLRYLSRFAPETAQPLLLKALDANDPILRQNAIDELDELNCREALPRLRMLLADPDAHVRHAAQTAVANLA